jgi:hypothetical protein
MIPRSKMWTEKYTRCFFWAFTPSFLKFYFYVLELLMHFLKFLVKLLTRFLRLPGDSFLLKLSVNYIYNLALTRRGINIIVSDFDWNEYREEHATENRRTEESIPSSGRHIFQNFTLLTTENPLTLIS